MLTLLHKSKNLSVFYLAFSASSFNETVRLKTSYFDK